MRPRVDHRPVLALLLASVSLALGVSAAASTRGVEARPPLALLFTGSGPTLGWNVLTRVDPVTRTAVGRSLRVSGALGGPSFSPDRQGLALSLYQNDAERLLVVDLRTMRALRTVLRWPAAYAWLTSRSLVAVSEGALVAVDPATGRVRERKRLPRDWYVEGWAPTGGRDPVMVVFSEDTDALFTYHEHRERVAVVDSNAHARFASVRIRGASYHDLSLAVDSPAHKAFLAGHGGPVAVVDLRTMAVSYHMPKPPLASGNGETFLRSAGAHTLVSYGYTSTNEDADEGFSDGVRLIDTRTWRSRTIDPTALFALVAADRVVTYGAWGASSLVVSAYGLNGSRVFSLDTGATVWQFSEVDHAGSYLYAPASVPLQSPPSDRTAGRIVVDLRDGSIVRELPGRQTPATRILQPGG